MVVNATVIKPVRKKVVMHFLSGNIKKKNYLHGKKVKLITYASRMEYRGNSYVRKNMPGFCTR